MPGTVLDLGFDGARPFATGGGPRLRTSGVALREGPAPGSVELAPSTRIKVSRDPALDGLDQFTVDLEVTPSRTDRAQVLLASQNPPLRVELDGGGKVVASVHTADGWQEVSSTKALRKGQAAAVRVARDPRGRLSIDLDGAASGTGSTGGALVPTGRGGITVGADASGGMGFAGALGKLRISDVGLSLKAEKALRAKEKKYAGVFSGSFKVPVDVHLLPGAVDDRFNRIKAIMNACGVEDLSDLSTLQVQHRTVLTPGTVLKAPRASLVPVVDFPKIAVAFARAQGRDRDEARKLLDGVLLTRSVSTRAASTITDAPTTVLGTRPAPRTGPSPLGRRAPRLPDVVSTRDLSRITAVESVERLRRDRPSEWPVMAAAPMVVRSLVIPVSSAVIIARRLDLTNQTLELDPAVGTLYIIAEEIEARSGARITWRRPVLDVPNIGPDPSLDGHPNWSGVHTGDDSKDGLPGGDARTGAGGIAGRTAQDSPSVEVWVLRMNGMPDIDLAGQQGGAGGRGQQGGRGGRGADGKPGEWWWFFGKQCWSDPGSGGNGGHGGDGGRGGRGGNGGSAGSILFAVLQDSLDELTTSNAFTPDLSAGRAGDGGDGGFRGEGGRGGARGYTDVCDGGRAGAQGQPGIVGAKGDVGSAGRQGSMRIMTVTQEAWDEQLTKPWLYDVTPDAALPGSNVVVKGSRFADTDTLVLGTRTLAHTLRPDEGLDVTLPDNLDGGEQQLYLRRQGGQESNRLPLVIKPVVTGALPTVVPGSTSTVTGHAFLPGATVDYDGDLYPATGVTPTSLTFVVPETAGAVASEHTVGLTVVNPDGQRSNTVTATVPRVAKNGFLLGVHDFSFANDANGTPSWSTFEDTYGGVEVWHELLDPVFGHPVLTTAFYFFYEEFLKGEDNGGLATGFCTALASMSLDRFWLGHNDTFSSVVRDAAFRKQMTAIHGRLLTRESLLDFHDQGRRGQANVVTVFREIEAEFTSGGTRETAPLLFFVPAGDIWDEGYFDMLSDSHCIVPIRITYPQGNDGSATLDGIRMHCWDNNHPADPNCFVDFRVVGGETRFTYTAAGAEKFKSEDKITLASATLGEYLLRDLDLPFGGPLGLTTFVLDFLLSPATLQVVDDNGRVTGRSGDQLLSEIPGSHPAYLLPGAVLLPPQTGLTRRITGTASGTYTYASLTPTGTSLGLTDVPTAAGQVDRLLANADGTRVRFAPGAAKTANLTVARQVSGQARGVSVEGFGATPTNELDITSSPDLSLVRLTNPGPATTVDLKVLAFNTSTSARSSVARTSVDVPTDSDLVLAVSSWSGLDDSKVTASVVATP
jgi:hypothetical protein